MRKATMFILALAVAAVWLQVQAVGQASDQGSSSTTLQGCLKFSRNAYRLIDSSGQSHRLVGEANKLKKEIGHQVELTGTPYTRAIDTTQQGAASTTRETQAFRVSAVKQIADTCSSGK